MSGGDGGSGKEQPDRIRKLLESLNSAQKKTPTSRLPSQLQPQQQQKAPSASSQQRKEHKEKSATPIKTPASRRSGTSSVAARINNQQQSASGTASEAAAEKAETSTTAKRTKQNSISRSTVKQQQQSGQSTSSTSAAASVLAGTASPRSSIRPPQIGFRIPTDVLDDICFRFISNLPKNEKESTVRVMFQIELAHWFYVDFYCEMHAEGDGARKDCQNIGIKDFTTQMFWHCHELSRYKSRVDEVIDEWRRYKSNVPTYGAILLDSSLNHVLLVQGFFASKNSWGFPKGKVNENEAPRDCAVREVREETGYDFDERSSRKKEFKIQKFIGDTMIRLYVVPDVPMQYKFAPQTRKEIRQIQWFNVWDLPCDRNEPTGKFTKNKYYMIMPFVQDLHSYIRKEQQKRKIRPQYSTLPEHLPSYSFPSGQSSQTAQQSTQPTPLSQLLLSAAGRSQPTQPSSASSVSTSSTGLPLFPAPANVATDDLLHSLFGTPQTAAGAASGGQQAAYTQGNKNIQQLHNFPVQQSAAQSQQLLGYSGGVTSAASSSPSTTHFRPLNAQISLSGQTNLQQQQSPQSALSMLWSTLPSVAGANVTLAGSASSGQQQPKYVAAQKPQPSSSHTHTHHVTPPIVHPIPVHSHHLPPAALTSPRASQQPRRSARLNPSHTSAFEVIPRAAHHGSAQQLHTAVGPAILHSPRKSDDVIKYGCGSPATGHHLKSPEEQDADSHSHRTPISVRSNSTDITGELLSLQQAAADRLPHFTIQPCGAWNEFKFDEKFIQTLFTTLQVQLANLHK